MAGLQQIFTRHSYIIILIRAFVAYIPQRRIFGIRGPGKGEFDRLRQKSM